MPQYPVALSEYDTVSTYNNGEEYSCLSSGFLQMQSSVVSADEECQYKTRNEGERNETL